MKVITRKIPARVSKIYQCQKCKNKYKSKARALKCEAQSIEQKLFRVGDAVTWREKRTCHNGKIYSLRGRIESVRGPVVPDEEYNIKWLQGALSGQHIFEYIVSWRCPHCSDELDNSFYGMELIKLKK